MLSFVVACSTLSSCLAASHHVLGLPQKSRKSSAMNTYKKRACNPFRMNTCKTLDLKSLCFQHLQKKGRGWVIMVNQHPAKGAGPERPSGAERPLSSPEYTMQGVTLSISSASLATERPFTPNCFRKGLPLSLSLQRAKIISLRFNRLRTLYTKHPGVPSSPATGHLFTPSELGEGPPSVVYWPRQFQGGSHELVVTP